MNSGSLKSLSWHQLDQQLLGYYVASSHDGSIVITGVPEGLIRIFMRDHKGIWQQAGEYHNADPLTSIICNKDASYIIIGSKHYMVVLSWNGKDIKPVFKHEDEVVTLSCSDDGNLIAVCAGKGHIDYKKSGSTEKGYRQGYAFEYTEGGWRRVWSYTFQHYSDNLERVICSGDGQRIITGSWNSDNTLRIFQKNKEEWVEKVKTSQVGNNTFWSMKTNYDGSIIIAGQATDLTASIFAYEGGTTLTEVATLNIATRLASVDVACSNDGSIVIIGGGSDGYLGFYVRTSGYTWEKRKLFKVPSHVDYIACTADASVCFSGVGGEKTAVYIFEAHKIS